jgi:hypothetical protein
VTGSPVLGSGSSGPHRNRFRWGPLLARRSPNDPDDLAYALALAPTEVSPQELARVAATRSVGEPCLEEAKRETGLDQDEVRHWPSWCRHLTRSLLAPAWLASIPSQAEAQAGAVPQAWPARPCPRCAGCWRWRCRQATSASRVIAALNSIFPSISPRWFVAAAHGRLDQSRSDPGVLGSHCAAAL